MKKNFSFLSLYVANNGVFCILVNCRPITHMHNLQKNEICVIENKNILTKAF